MSSYKELKACHLKKVFQSRVKFNQNKNYPVNKVSANKFKYLTIQTHFHNLLIKAGSKTQWQALLRLMTEEKE